MMFVTVTAPFSGEHSFYFFCRATPVIDTVHFLFIAELCSFFSLGRHRNEMARRKEFSTHAYEYHTFFVYPALGKSINFISSRYLFIHGTSLVKRERKKWSIVAV